VATPSPDVDERFRDVVDAVDWPELDRLAVPCRALPVLWWLLIVSEEFANRGDASLPHG